MSKANVFLPSYSVGTDCYEEVRYVTRRFGKKAVVIGGKTAMEKGRPALEASLAGTDLTITDFVWYGDNATYANAEALMATPAGDFASTWPVKVASRSSSSLKSAAMPGTVDFSASMPKTSWW